MANNEPQEPIDLKMLKRLHRFMEQGGLVELDIEMEGVKVKLRKGGPGATQDQPVVVVPQQVQAGNGYAQPPVAAAAAPQAPATAPVQATAPAPAAGIHVIKSPMIGSFYRSPSPDKPAFANEGDYVKEGQTVFIIEAMKLMNEIKADKAGRVVKIHPENGQPVEFDQPLMEIDTTASPAPSAQ